MREPVRVLRCIENADDEPLDGLGLAGIYSSPTSSDLRVFRRSPRRELRILSLVLGTCCSKLGDSLALSPLILLKILPEELLSFLQSSLVSSFAAEKTPDCTGRKWRIRRELRPLFGDAQPSGRFEDRKLRLRGQVVETQRLPIESSGQNSIKSLDPALGVSGLVLRQLQLRFDVAFLAYLLAFAFFAGLLASDSFVLSPLRCLKPFPL
ncbi:hypothetical protein LO762_03755 [Actinocorallia sp. API 0066]|uniref:hypothetical protein n=1 Tax=Actinocorallia sp. API 0066 TaxID=2896846 RepID=UPI001E29328A|nr:hypothetical protein [Actinocorallia sp. API 0066]MCD0448314.1 hypothetical protein [Actinocorallia sp. API 0066]